MANQGLPGGQTTPPNINSLAAQGIQGAGLGSAAGTTSYAFLQDMTAPDGIPTSTWEERGVAGEALTEGALVAGLTFGLGKAIQHGQVAMQGRKILPKSVALAMEKGQGNMKGYFDGILGSKTAQKLQGTSNRYLIEEQQKADDLLVFLRNQGITPSYGMLVQNDTVRSLLYSLGRTPVLGTPARQAYDDAKRQLFERIALGVDKNLGISMERALAPITDKFEKVGKGYQLKPGVELDQVDDMGLVVDYIKNMEQRSVNINSLYSKADELIKKEKFDINDFQDTKRNWLNFSTTGVGVQNYSQNGRELKDILLRETKEMADILFKTGAKGPAGQVLKQPKDKLKAFQNEEQLVIKVNNEEILVPKSIYEKYTKPGKGVQATKENPSFEDRNIITAINNPKMLFEGKKWKQYSKQQQDNIIRNNNIELTAGVRVPTDTANASLLKKYTPQNIQANLDGNVGEETLSLAAKAFEKKSLPEQLVIFKKQINTEFAAASERAKYIGAPEGAIAMQKATSNLRRNLNNDIQKFSGTDTVSAYRAADKAYIDNIDLLENSQNFIKRIRKYQISEKDGGAALAARLDAADNISDDIFNSAISGSRIDETGEILSRKFKIEQVPGKNFSRYVLDKDKNPIPLTAKEQIGVPGLSQKRLEDIAGPNTIKEGDLVNDLFLTGNTAQIKQFKELVGQKNYKKAVVAQFENDVNETIIKFLNTREGEAGAALKAWYKKMGVGDAAQTARYKTMIDEANLNFNYDELVQMTRMMELLPEAPALNQFIQRSMMLRMSQGIGPNAISGLFGLGAVGGGAAAAGPVGALAGIGVLYAFNTLMATPATANTVKGLIKNYKSAMAAGNKEKAEKFNREYLRMMDIAMKPFYKLSAASQSSTGITFDTLKQTAINLGVSEDFE